MNLRMIYLIWMSLIFLGCGGGDDSMEPKTTALPENLQVMVEISGATNENPEGDGSGMVTFTATADNTASYRIVYDDEQTTMNNGVHTLVFDERGTQSYTVRVIAIGTGNGSVSEEVTVEVLRKYEIPADLLTLLTNNSSQKWRIRSEVAGHMGVGPASSSSPEYWAAQAFEKDYTSMYDDEYTFSTDNLFKHDTKGAVYGQADPLDNDLGSTGEEKNADNEYENYPLTEYSGQWDFATIDGVETLYLPGNGFFGFYVGGTHAYSIIEKTEKDLILRTEGSDGNGWFFVLTTEEFAGIPADPEYTNLIWEDNFDTAGSPNADKWTYDIGKGDNGWGNNEAQYYTDRLDNVEVKDGLLHITAKKESYMDASYTSSRIKTQGKFSFTYGRVDIKAKLPQGGGTWPAMWMLGTNITAVGWPACGEIDIMEYVGNNPGHIQSAIHTTADHGDISTKKAITIENENSDFHVYSVIWSEDQISFLLDGERFYTYSPLIKSNDNWPFAASQFLILNVAMGGTLGGSIDSSFTESEMIIDYVRVYQ